MVGDRHCPVCGGHDLKLTALSRRPTYYSCNDCGHNFIKLETNNQKEKFAEAQSQYYGEESILLDYGLSTFEDEIMRVRFGVLRKFLRQPSKVIEVGPGAGHVLKWLADSGLQVTAVEHSSILSKQLASRLNLSVINAEFETHDFGQAAFDAFCSFHVIEHVSDPLVHLSKALEIVRPGGLAFVATPNATSWEQRVAPALGPNFDAAHLHIFSPESLTRACKKIGWEVVLLETPESAGGWARVLSAFVRVVRKEDASRTAGKYARSPSTIIKAVAGIFQFVTVPIRCLQRRLGAGNEIFVVLRKPN